MSIQINLPASLVNAERVFKYYIDPLHPETHGWYLYELDEAGSNSYTRNMTDAISQEEGDIYLLDDTTPNNVLLGGEGADRIYGGGGNNVLHGGDGRDIFGYSIDTIGGLDIIEDFIAGDDKMHFYKFKTEDVRIASGHGHDIKEGDYGDSAIEDAVIYNTRGTSDLSDDIAFLILSDYDADDLTMNESGSYLCIV